jgi:hypothetical protein
MSKEVYYFPHDYHARKDPKCQALISMYGIEAYGVYWSLMEIMHEQGGKIRKFPALYAGLSFELRIDKVLLTKQIEAMLNDFELLLQDDNFMWSERVLQNIKFREAKKLLRSEAGRIGGIKSGISRQRRSNASEATKQNEANEAKKRKEKKIITNMGETANEQQNPLEVQKVLDPKIGLVAKTPKQKLFTKPTVHEISAYCTERRNTIDPQYFFDYQEQRGWLLKGGIQMQDWKATIRTWERNDGNVNGRVVVTQASERDRYAEIMAAQKERNRKGLEDDANRIHSEQGNNLPASVGTDSYELSVLQR